MGSEKFKENVNKATDFIVSCWDENNPDDNKTFDERIQSGLKDLDPEVREIVTKSLD